LRQGDGPACCLADEANTVREGRGTSPLKKRGKWFVRRFPASTGLLGSKGDGKPTGFPLRLLFFRKNSPKGVYLGFRGWMKRLPQIFRVSGGSRRGISISGICGSGRWRFLPRMSGKRFSTGMGRKRGKGERAPRNRGAEPGGFARKIRFRGKQGRSSRWKAWKSCLLPLMKRKCWTICGPVRS